MTERFAPICAKSPPAARVEFKTTPMIGRSHGIHAEPITCGLKLALMYDEFGRALERLSEAQKRIRVGKLSGAVGTHAHLDPRVEERVCRRLGLQPAALSTQVIQRDRHAEFHTVLAIIASSIDRWATEFRHLQRTEVLEVEEYFSAGQKGSSAMPHKRNPITGEKLSGLARVVRGNAVAALENVALWHERDISHSSVERIVMPDSCILVDYMLVTLSKLVERLLVYPENMERNLRITQRALFQPDHPPQAHGTRAGAENGLRSRAARRDEDVAGRAEPPGKSRRRTRSRRPAHPGGDRSALLSGYSLRARGRGPSESWGSLQLRARPRGSPFLRVRLHVSSERLQ